MHIVNYTIEYAIEYTFEDHKQVIKKNFITFVTINKFINLINSN